VNWKFWNRNTEPEYVIESSDIPATTLYRWFLYDSGIDDPNKYAILNDCKFNKCQHINEPGCAVKQAVAEGVIAADRYVSYVSMQDSIEKKW
jgi:hypothetical protein